MGVPYEMQPMSGVVVQGGHTRTFEVDFPSRAIISKIVAKQMTGTPGAFDLTLFNHPITMEPAGQSESDSEGSETGKIPEECYQVTPKLTSDGTGLLVYFSDEATGGHGFAFFNQERPQPPNQKGNRRKLYVRITATGSGPKTFAFCAGGESLD